ncbi:unnamed protein product, partial [Didymodactylos carnosus]
MMNDDDDDDDNNKLHIRFHFIQLSNGPIVLNNNSASSSSLLSFTSTDSSGEDSTDSTTSDYYKIEAKFNLKPHVTDESLNLQLQKFKRLLKRLEPVYSNTSNEKVVTAANTVPKMPTASVLPPPSMNPRTGKQFERYRFNSSNRTKKNSSSSTPPSSNKRYKFADSQSDHEPGNIYHFRKGGKTDSSFNSPDRRSLSSDRYDFNFDKENIGAGKTATLVRSGSGLDGHTPTYMHGTQLQNGIGAKKLTVTTPYRFPPSAKQKDIRHPSQTSSFDEETTPEKIWESKHLQPKIVFDSTTDNKAGGQKRVRIDDPQGQQMAYDRNYKLPTRVNTITTTNGVDDTLKYPKSKQTPLPPQVQVVRLEPPTTTNSSRSYLKKAQERLDAKRHGPSPQSFNKSLDHFFSSTIPKLEQKRWQQDHQQRVIPPPAQFQQPQVIDPANVTIEALRRRLNVEDYHQRSPLLRKARDLPRQPQPTSPYRSQYYANSDDDQQLQKMYPTPPIDYPMDSDDSASEDYNRSLPSNVIPTTSYIRGQVPSAYLAHSTIMKNVNRSLLAKDFNNSTQTLTTSSTMANKNRLKLLDRAVHRQLKTSEHRSLQRELSHNLIRCFSTTYVDDLRREDLRYKYNRTNMKSYTNEDIEDIYMSASLENYKMKTEIDREKRTRSGLSSSMDHQSLSTPSSSSIIGRLSPLSLHSPMTISTSHNRTQNGSAGDVQSLGFEPDRRSLRSTTSPSQTVSNIPPDIDLFYEIVQEHFRGVDATIAGQVSNASRYTTPKNRRNMSQQQQILSKKPIDQDSDIEINSNSSFWSDEDEQQMNTNGGILAQLPQRHINRYLSTVNRSLLDRPSNLISDYYISHLNRSMKDSVRSVEVIARNIARNRWRDEFDQSSKLGRSLSAEHLYQVRREHLRYRQPFTTPASFTAEDVSDIYKPFQLENYKRKIAIEVERRRRERQGQLAAGVRSPMYANEPDLHGAVKSHQPVIQVPIIPVNSSNHLPSRARPVYNTLGTGSQQFDHNNNIILNGSDISRNNISIVDPPVVHSNTYNRPITDHVHIDTARSSIQQPYDDHSEKLKISPKPNAEIRIRQDRAQTKLEAQNGLVNGALKASQQVLMYDQEPVIPDKARRRVQIIPTQPSSATSIHKPKIYTHSPIVDTIKMSKAGVVIDSAGSEDLSTAKVKSITTYHKGKINKPLVVQQTQPLPIEHKDVEHARIAPSQGHPREQIQSKSPVILNAHEFKRLKSHDQEVEKRLHQYPSEQQKGNLIIPEAKYMVPVEQDIHVYENIEKMHHLQQIDRHHL